MENKYAIDTNCGDVLRNEVLKIVTRYGYKANSHHEWHSRLGYNTVYFEGDTWTNWEEKTALEKGFTIISAKDFLENPSKYLTNLEARVKQEFVIKIVDSPMFYGGLGNGWVYSKLNFMDVKKYESLKDAEYAIMNEISFTDGMRILIEPHYVKE